MKRSVSYTVTAAEEGWTVEKVLRGSMGFTKREISRAKFTKDGILLNGSFARSNQTVHEREILTVTVASAEANQKKGPASREECAGISEKCIPDVVYEDADVIVLDKPSGMVCHPSHGHYGDSLAQAALEHCRRVGEAFPIRCVGRLDKDTSGLVLFAKNRLAAARLARQREQGLFHKEYTALVHGGFSGEERSGWIRYPLRKCPGKPLRMEAVTKEEKGLVAATFYEVLCQDTHWSLVRCLLETGRTHQIRVHLAAIGHPLFGDPLYGVADGGSRAALHAGKLSFCQPLTGETIELVSFRRGMYE